MVVCGGGSNPRSRSGRSSAQSRNGRTSGNSIPFSGKTAVLAAIPCGSGGSSGNRFNSMSAMSVGLRTGGGRSSGSSNSKYHV